MGVFQTIGRNCRRGWAAFSWTINGAFWRRARYDTVEIDLSGSFPERRLPSSMLDLRRRGGLTHRTLLELIDFLVDDPRVKRVLITFGPTAIGMARLQEIARALDRLKAAGKERIALIEGSLGTREFLLAARCERRVMAPSALLALTGLNMEITYLRGLLDKADVEPELLVAGKFKNAAEIFTRKTASQAANEMTEGLLDDLYEQLTADLAQALDLSPARVAKLIDGGPYTAARALRAGLVTDLKYRDELLADLHIKNERRLLRAVRYHRVISQHTANRAVMIDAPVVALVHVAGTIRDGVGDPARGLPGARGMVKLLRRLRTNRQVKAVVVRVSSPGGAAGGSDLIRRELHNLAAKKPVVVSFGDVAASGGYLVGVEGETILAERGTLTGSIGVIAGKFDVSGLLAKFGVSVEAHRRGAAAGIFSGSSGYSDTERKRMGEIVKATYESFKNAVATGRDLSAKKVDAVAEGRVWTGRQALAHGLVDDLGGLTEALQKAKDLAGGVEGEPVRLLELPALPSPWRMLFAMGENRLRLPGALESLLELREINAGPYAGLPFKIRLF